MTISSVRPARAAERDLQRLDHRGPRRRCRRVRVARHGNRSATGCAARADLLEALGARIDLDPGGGVRMRRRGRLRLHLRSPPPPRDPLSLPLRKALGVRTVFNLLGPLTNPAGRRGSSSGWETGPSLELDGRGSRPSSARGARAVGRGRRRDGRDQHRLRDDALRGHAGRRSREHTISPERGRARACGPEAKVRGGDAGGECGDHPCRVRRRARRHGGSLVVSERRSRAVRRRSGYPEFEEGVRLAEGDDRFRGRTRYARTVRLARRRNLAGEAAR